MSSKKIPSPLATGGAGYNYERQVGAAFLAKLLIGGVPQFFSDCHVEEVGFQTKYRGWETDDLLVVCSNDRGEKHKMAIQAKYSFIFGVHSQSCKQTFQKFWKDFQNAEIFDPDKDVLVLVTRVGSRTLDSLISVLDAARNSSDAEDFFSRLRPEGFLSAQANDCQYTIRRVVEQWDSSRVDDEAFWRFLKSIRLLFLDFTMSESEIIQNLALVAHASDRLDIAKNTWNELLNIAGSHAEKAGTLRRPDLPSDMCSLYDAVGPLYAIRRTLTDHSNIVLYGIRSTIGNDIRLPRHEVTSKVVESLNGNKVIVLRGPPGCGKSALAKTVIEQQVENYLCLSFRAEEFAVAHVDKAFPDSITGPQFEMLVGSSEMVLIHIESLERIFEQRARDAFTDLVGMVERHPNIRLLLTCRDQSVEIALRAFITERKLSYTVFGVPPFEEKELEHVKNSFPKLATPLADPRLKRLMRSPYLLDVATRMDWPSNQPAPSGISAFREKYWSEMVRKDHLSTPELSDRREQTLVRLAIRRARELRPFVSTEQLDVTAIADLYKDGIVLKKGVGLAAPAHDIIEDWTIMRWIESLAVKHEWHPSGIVEQVGAYPALRRGFREWLKTALDEARQESDRFVLSVYRNDSLPQYFRDDVIVAALLSNKSHDFIRRQKDQLLADDARLLTRMMHLTRVACRHIPKRSGNGTASLAVLLEPEGKAWPTLLGIIADELDCLLPTHHLQILGLLEDWSRGARVDVPVREGDASAGRIAYRLLEYGDDYRYDDIHKRVLKTIVRMPCSNEQRFTNLVKRVSSGLEHHDTLLEELSKLLIEGVYGTPACKAFPELITQLTMSWCCLEKRNLECVGRFGDSSDVAREFGLHPRTALNFLPASALRGPFYPMLLHHPNIGINLILDFVNRAGVCYGEQWYSFTTLEPAYLVTIPLLDREITQWANERLWQAYRGTSVTPYVIQCALMALERWLLEMCEILNDVEPLLLRILRESNSVMTTAVVASVCNAHPDMCGSVGLALLRSRECVMLDSKKKLRESYSIMNTFSTDIVVNEERSLSNKLKHRSYGLVDLALRLQSGDDAKQVWEIIDKHKTKIPNKDNRTDEDRSWLLLLNMMDARRQTSANLAYAQQDNEPKSENQEEKTIDTDLQRFVDDRAVEMQQIFPAISLLNWGQKQWNEGSKIVDDDAWKTFLAWAKITYQAEMEQGNAALYGGPGIVAAVCVRYHLKDLTADDRRWCIDVLVAEIEQNADSNDTQVHVQDYPLSPDRHAAYVLPKVLSHEPDNEALLKAVVQAITHASPQVSLYAAMGVAEYLGTTHRDLVLRCAGAVAMSINLLQRNNPKRGHAQSSWFFVDPRVAKECLMQSRTKFLKNRIDVERELTELNFMSQPGRYASMRVLSMLSAIPDLSHTKELFIKAVQTIVDAWAPELTDIHTRIDFEFEQHVMNTLARLVLTLSSDEACLYCQPLLDAVNKFPDDVSSFIDMLNKQGSMQYSNSNCFWDVWQAFACAIIDAPPPSLSYRQSVRAQLIDSMLFRTVWQGKPHSWAHLADHTEKINEFMARLPATPPVLTSFIRYLYYVGQSSLPESFAAVRACLQKRNSADLLGRGDTVFHLELLLGQYVYSRSANAVSDPELRNTIIAILDRLVDAGSSTAYLMRDDFVTPNTNSL